ncbi:MAG: hypothetical protein HY665_06645 [Chloroflexi bacterium]|nr:hypothetical protein [Chloroflexota bacterium]
MAKVRLVVQEGVNRQELSHTRENETVDVVGLEDGYLREKRPASLDTLEYSFPDTEDARQGQSSAHLLDNAVVGANKCAIFLFDPVKNHLSLMAQANLSPDFINALLKNGEGKRLVKLAAQAKPYLVIHLPDNRKFRDLWELAERESIKTLWLVPWNGHNGSPFGVFLFAYEEICSPSRELASIMSLVALISSMFRHTSGDRGEGVATADDQLDSDIKVESNREIIVAEPAGRALATPRQDEPLHGKDEATGAPSIYQDGYGLPVLYDSATDVKRRKSQPDPVSVLSHELLSPLTLIKGYTATLLQLSDSITDEQKGQYLQRIEIATNKVIRLLENLRDIARLEEKDTVAVEPTQLPDMLRPILSDMQSQTTKHIIKFRQNGRLPAVKINRQKIEQVMTNLLANAVKYSPKGGDIETTVRLVQDELEFEEIFGKRLRVKLPCLVVSISDSGMGIPDEELDRIFERFYRVESRLARTIPGAGLGLYICKIIVEAHSGCIWAQNKPRAGSVFSFSLPIA